MGLRDVGQLLHELDKGHNILSNMSRNISETPEPKNILQIIFNALKTLQINIAVDNLIAIKHHTKYLEILQIVGQDIVKAQTTELVCTINNVVKEIRDSKEWYAFLVDVHDALLQLPVSDASSFAIHRRIRSTAAVTGNDTSLTELLTEIESYGIKGYENIKISGISNIQFRALRNVLRTAKKEETTVSCLDGDKIFAKGVFVKLSEVLIKKCDKQLRSIEIFASDTVLIDQDLEKVGEEIQVSILAPRWNATGHRRIVLSGSAGPRHDPQRAAAGSWSGQHGQPGLPGGGAGEATLLLLRNMLRGTLQFTRMEEGVVQDRVVGMEQMEQLRTLSFHIQGHIATTHETGAHTIAESIFKS
jgi:hypothetical protein